MIWADVVSLLTIEVFEEGEDRMRIILVKDSLEFGFWVLWDLGFKLVVEFLTSSAVHRSLLT